MDDFVYNVSQIIGFPHRTTAQLTDAVLMQSNGLGGGYVWTTPDGIVNALSSETVTFGEVITSGNVAIGGVLEVAGGTIGLGPQPALSIFANATQFGIAFPNAKNAVLTLTEAGELQLNLDSVVVSRNPLLPMEVATMQYVQQQVAGMSFAPLASPALTGTPTINGTAVATTANISAAVNASVVSFNARTGAVSLTASDLTGVGGAMLASPAFSGTPTAPTAATGNSSGQIANTQFASTAANAAFSNAQTWVNNQNFAPRANPVFTGNVVAPNIAATGVTIAGQAVATMAWVNGQNYAPVSSPNFIGSVQLNGQPLATQVWVTSQITNLNIAKYAPINSPTFTGEPRAPTPDLDDQSTRIATTLWSASFMCDQIDALDLDDYAKLDSPVFVGQPLAPTPPAHSNDGKIATTAFVMGEIESHIAGVASFNTRTGHVTLENTDIQALNTWAPLNSPNLTGNPHSITFPAADNSTRIATTAYVQNVLDLGAVRSFNGRNGAVLLTVQDIVAAMGAPINSPSFTGEPFSTTPDKDDDSTRIATTAYVHDRMAWIEHDLLTEFNCLKDAFVDLRDNTVWTFNQRKGHVTLHLNDVLAAGGAPLESPDFRCEPRAPTAMQGVCTDQIATTRFVCDAVKAIPSGPAGVNGPPGPPGAALQIKGSVAIFSDLPAEPDSGDVYLVQLPSPTRAYVWDGGAWQSIPTGPQGLPGPAGPTGPQGPAGAGIPIKGMIPTYSLLPMVGNMVGDLWIAVDTGQAHLWEGTAWSPGQNMVGPQGPAGAPGATGPAGPQGPSGGGAAVGTSPPASPQTGDLWSDTTTTPPLLKLWNGTAWVIVGGDTGGFLPLAGGIMSGAITLPADASGSQAVRYSQMTSYVSGQIGTIPPIPGVFTASTNGLAPLSGGGTANFLRADGTWAAPTVTGYLPLTGGVLTGNLTVPVVTLGADPTLNMQASTKQYVDSATAGMVTSSVLATALASYLALTGGSMTGPITLPADGAGSQAVRYSQLTSYVGTQITNIPTFSATVRGMTPLSGGGTANFLRADGSWAAPPQTTTLPGSAITGVVEAVTASYSLVAADNGKIKNVTAGSAITITCPNTLAVGFYCTVIQSGVGVITFAGSGGMVITNRQTQLRSAGQGAMCALAVTVANAMTLGGDTQT